MYSSLSRRMTVSGGDTAPAAVLRLLLGSVVQSLGDDLVGHAKAVAHLDGGVIHASTTGAPPEVDIQSAGDPKADTNEFQVDFMCVFHGLRTRDLVRAWDASLLALSGAGIATSSIQEVEGRPQSGRQIGAKLGVAGSLLTSFIALKPCCVLPALLSVSGGGISALQWLAPLEVYRPYFLLITALLLATAFVQLYVWTPEEQIEGIESSVRRGRAIFWLAALAFVAVTIIPTIVPTPQHDSVHSELHSH